MNFENVDTVFQSFALLNDLYRLDVSKLESILKQLQSMLVEAEKLEAYVFTELSRKIDIIQNMQDIINEVTVGVKSEFLQISTLADTITYLHQDNIDLLGIDWSDLDLDWGNENSLDRHILLFNTPVMQFLHSLNEKKLNASLTQVKEAMQTARTASSDYYHHLVWPNFHSLEQIIDRIIAEYATYKNSQEVNELLDNARPLREGIASLLQIFSENMLQNMDEYDNSFYSHRKLMLDFCTDLKKASLVAENRRFINTGLLDEAIATLGRLTITNKPPFSVVRKQMKKLLTSRKAPKATTKSKSSPEVWKKLPSASVVQATNGSTEILAVESNSASSPEAGRLPSASVVQATDGSTEILAVELNSTSSPDEEKIPSASVVQATDGSTEILAVESKSAPSPEAGRLPSASMETDEYLAVKSNRSSSAEEEGELVTSNQARNTTLLDDQRIFAFNEIVELTNPTLKKKINNLVKRITFSTAALEPGVFIKQKGDHWTVMKGWEMIEPEAWNMLVYHELVKTVLSKEIVSTEQDSIELLGVIFLARLISKEATYSIRSIREHVLCKFIDDHCKRIDGKEKIFWQNVLRYIEVIASVDGDAVRDRDKMFKRIFGELNKELSIWSGKRKFSKFFKNLFDDRTDFTPKKGRQKLGLTSDVHTGLKALFTPQSIATLNRNA